MTLRDLRTGTPTVATGAGLSSKSAGTNVIASSTKEISVLAVGRNEYIHTLSPSEAGSHISMDICNDEKIEYVPAVLAVRALSIRAERGAVPLVGLSSILFYLSVRNTTPYCSQYKNSAGGSQSKGSSGCRRSSSIDSMCRPGLLWH